MIYTSYFSNYRNFPVDAIPIGITRFPPIYWKGLNQSTLAPSAGLLNKLKNKEIDEYVFEQEYFAELRERGLTPDKVNTVLNKIAKDRNLILCCYEKPDEFCHRKLLSKWLGGNINEL